MGREDFIKCDCECGDEDISMIDNINRLSKHNKCLNEFDL